jgi:hypothetical protein
VPGLAEIAEAAGVGIATVGRVADRRAGANSGTRARVLAVARVGSGVDCGAEGAGRLLDGARPTGVVGASDATTSGATTASLPHSRVVRPRPMLRGSTAAPA